MTQNILRPLMENRPAFTGRVRYCLVLAVGLLLFAGSQCLASDFAPETSISLGATGNVVFAHPNRNVPSTAGLGGYLFFDWRPLSWASFGLGLGGLDFLGSTSWNVTEADLGGRLFPFGRGAKGEFYLQGGVGILPKQNDVDRSGLRVHGTVGVGYRTIPKKGLGLDLGLVYDAYSPRVSPLSVAGLKVGVYYRFGGWEKKAFVKNPALTTRAPQPEYTWQAGDDFKSVAKKVYGDSDYYPLLEDANKDSMDNAGGLKVGTRILIPKAPENVENPDEAQSQEKTETETSTGASRRHELPPPITAAELMTRHIPGVYRWRYQDNLESVADRLYGDSDLYPLLVDANQESVIHPDNLVPDTRIIVPRPPKTDEALDAIRDKSDQSPYTWWLGSTLRRALLQ